MIGLWFGNLLFYLTAIVLILQLGGVVVRVLSLTPRVTMILLGVLAATFAPALADGGHIPILVPFVAFPHFYVAKPAFLPWNIGLSALSAVAAVLIYKRRKGRITELPSTS